MNIREFIKAKSKGRYEEIAEMPHEEGGFGRLYRAVDARDHRIEVCIKVIKPNLSKGLQMKLWHDEVRALGLYRNRSGIVHLVEEQYEFERADPYWFLVMEYVHGDRLGSSKYRIELDIQEEQAIRLIFQLCSVIYSIHQRGHYHQDIFPDNIKIHQGEKLILLDLGGMREAERRSGTIIFGGEMYSPPEVSPTRLRMKRFRTLRKEEMGSFEKADIFSIGAIFYELTVGTPFFENVEQSNQLKDYIYDYYSDPAMLKRMKKEYQEAIDIARENLKNFYKFLERYQMPPELCDCFALTLSIHPQKRPSIESLLQSLIPYMLKRATQYYHQNNWKDAQLWIRFLERHFHEIQLEDQNADEVFCEKMLQHLIALFPLSIQTSLIQGICLFHQGQFETAQQTFLKTKEILEYYEDGCAGRQWNSFLLKIINNLAACSYKGRQNTEAQHLYKSLSTAEGNFGQIIKHNLQVCTT